MSTWAGFQLNVVDEAIDQWQKRLNGCVHTHGGHFKQLLLYSLLHVS